MAREVYRGRFTAQLDRDFVVFLIGMRVNRPLRVHKWGPVMVAMPMMLRWLEKHPQAGLLGWRFTWLDGPAVLQYWRSFEELDRFARAPEQPHLPRWKWFNKAIRASGDVGIWHETYRVRSGEYEAIYGNMPRIGLAAAGEHHPVGSTGQTAPARLGLTPQDQPPVAPYPNP